ncbi:MAG: selenocysteine-specific translation elongation factor [Anaerolineaceae bacterium]|nr:MAG: selenocysteine-specific translation elongation factor [Anaerolineaceae bacterium]
MPLPQPPEPLPMERHITIGVAGHVDHGKTSLVRCLTGIDTDRHPEEKRRGLSLEAGIACWPRPNGIMAAFVDVPGHRDFLKNTVRGLQGVDLAVLVVAADDGVMPQTREHLDILTFFQIAEGFVVMSKTDCVDPETLELAELEIMELTAGTFLEGKPIVRFSAVNGHGKDEVFGHLDNSLGKFRGKAQDKPFRLWIDQVRSFGGIGTVVSGTVLSGTVNNNDEIRILPGDICSRVRSLEGHGRQVEEAVAGQRIGVNLHRVGIAEISRGMCLVHPGGYSAVNRCNVTIRTLPHAGATIKDRQKVKVYLGTAVCTATVKIIDPPHKEITGPAFAQFQFMRPAVVAPGDHFVVAPLNRNTIIAGGTALELGEEKLREANRNPLAERLNALQDAHFDNYLEQLCRLHPGEPFTPRQVAKRTAWGEDTVQQYIAEGVRAGRLAALPDGGIVRQSDIEDFAHRFVALLVDAFHRQPEREPMQVREIMDQCRPSCAQKLAQRIVEDLCQRGGWVKEKGGIRPADFKLRLPEDLQVVAVALQRYAGEQGIRPFSAEFFAKKSGKSFTLRQVQRALDFSCKTDEMIRLKNDRYLTRAAMAEIKNKIAAWIARYGEFHLRDCQEVLDFNRGLGQPVLEYLDDTRFTIRIGEGRRLAGDPLHRAA